MRAFKRGLYSLVHNRFKTLLLFIVFFVIVLLLLLTNSVREAAEIGLVQIRRDIGAIVTVRHTEATLTSTSEDGTVIPLEFADRLASAEQVDRANYLISCVAHSPNGQLEAIPFFSDPSFVETLESSYMNGESQGQFRIEGTASSEEHWKFSEKHIELLEGRHFTAEDEGHPYALISNLAAQKNLLKIGDTISIASDFNGVEVELEIIGIHSGTLDGGYPDNINACNYIFTPIEFALELSGGNVLHAEYHIADPEEVNTFVSEGEALADQYDIDLKFISYNLDYVLASNSLNAVKHLCLTMQYTGVAVSLLVFCLIAVYFILGRYYEMGVLMSLGEKKRNICLQLVWELLCPMILAVLVGGVIGGLAMGALGERLLSIAHTGYTGITPSHVLAAGVWCLGLVTVVSVIPIVYILRYKPRDILAKSGQ